VAACEWTVSVNVPTGTPAGHARRTGAAEADAAASTAIAMMFAITAAPSLELLILRSEERNRFTRLTQSTIRRDSYEVKQIASSATMTSSILYFDLQHFDLQPIMPAVI
jgi:hypothetical protein